MIKMYTRVRSSAGWAIAVIAMAGGWASAATPIADCKSYSGIPADEGDKSGLVFIPGGSFTMGSDQERPEERYSHVVRVDGFWIDQHEVTNAEFEHFVKATGYVTLAERGVDPKTHPNMTADLTAPVSSVHSADQAWSRRRHHPVVAICEGRELAAAGGTGLVHRGHGEPSGGACRL